MSIDLSGKVVIVTGGAKGIGEGCVQKFLDSNATVVSLDHSVLPSLRLIHVSVV
jgi:NAD(P)-dependent dehydrogenase (short-subunit alcohol dehydrogenase family)